MLKQNLFIQKIILHNHCVTNYTDLVVTEHTDLEIKYKDIILQGMIVNITTKHS